ncbi:MAG: TIR domain-containing protein [Gemmataceae bacterium]
MVARTFLSFRSEDEFKVWALRNLAEFENVDFEMDDVSLRKAIDSRDETYVKSVIRPKIQQCRYCLCLVGESTHKSRKWIPWEIGVAQEEGKTILAMRFKDTPNAETPAILKTLGITPFDWDLAALDRKLKT